ncbi:MAG TPA: serine/threonine-protein kinase [Polyangia bacterium]|jgi:serine/threonine-protein kinase|nr:serine/threonine-protein kinase [Polyangia bacterium]
MANPGDLVGREVGRYTVLSHLASGGMAELYIARQHSVGGFEKQVVLKILQPRYAKNPRVVTMFLDEARLAAKLNHPAIVHVYDVADEGGLKYIAMEYIHGETIADIVKRGLAVDRYLPLEHAVHIVSQTAAGLAYAHERKEADGHVVRIVHRDVSPTNILVSYEGQTEIVDFGIARAQDELREESGILPGKASYMSPEQVRGEVVDHRSDIFALGIILYELTLCQRLYRGPAEAVMKRIVNERVQPPTAIRRDYPAALELIVMRALEKRAEDRYQSAQQMHDDLEEFLDESGLRSGNRRVAIYMSELFAPGAAAGGGGEAVDEPEALDFDRRAPLSMRIEPAAEAERRPSSPAVVAAVAPRAPRPVALPAAGAPAAVVGVPREAAGRSRGSWIVLAAFIVLGIGAMVILTLR